MLIDVVLIGILILVNGFFAAAEMALVTTRRTRLKMLVKADDLRAAKVLAVQDNPGDFLAMVQIGITLVGTTAAAVGGAEAVRILSPFIASIQRLEPYSQEIALVIVIVFITYFTLVFGELVPKRLAMRNAENIALTFTGPLGLLSRLAHLPIRALSFSADAVLKLIGSAAAQYPPTSLEEIEFLVQQGTVEGVIQPMEERWISGVFDFSDRRVQDVMTPRTSIVALKVETLPSEALRRAKRSGYSRFPVFRSDLDQVVGYVHIKDIIWAKGDTNLRPYIRKIHFIPSGASLPRAFDVLTKTGTHIAIVLDEYGGTQGLLTLEDMLEEIVGEIEDEHSPITEQFEHPTNGNWIFAGITPISDVAELLGVDFQPQGIYTTLAGFIFAGLGKIPDPGEQIVKHGYIFTVKEMDRLRITSVYVRHSVRGKLS
ncbi:hemolysin family protein [Chloroflexota bacterium]